MSPTPLHIPTSQISPISEISHERILIRPVGEGKQFVLLLLKKIIKSFPMIFIKK